MSAPLCFLDCETDGVHPGRKVWEVAAIRRDDRGEQTYHAFVEIDLSTADPFGPGEEMTYPAGEYEYGGPGCYLEASAAAADVARFCHGAHIVGAVPNFDTEVLAALLREHGLTPAWHYHLCDVEALAIGYLHGRLAEARLHAGVPLPPWEGALGLPWDSEALSRACGVEPPGEDERHTALGDATWAMRLYDAITGKPA